MLKPDGRRPAGAGDTCYPLPIPRGVPRPTILPPAALAVKPAPSCPGRTCRSESTRAPTTGARRNGGGSSSPAGWLKAPRGLPPWNSGSGSRMDGSQLARMIRCKKCGRELKLGTGDPPEPSSNGEGAALQPTQLSSGDTASTPPAKPPPAPKKIGRVEIRARIGAGAFGTVYRAYDPVLERDVALKVPRGSGARLAGLISFKRLWSRWSRNGTGRKRTSTSRRSAWPTRSGSLLRWATLNVYSTHVRPG